ncbi:MAG: hypothetical protein FWE28_07975 [Oscillospiraceae bacterium]|nr:hypothetical protein [Oscillospiraceae bacterium]
MKNKRTLGIAVALLAVLLLFGLLATPVLGHPPSPDDVLTTVGEPTCETAGYRVYTCSHCGRTRTAPGAAALGHNFVQVSERLVCGEVPTRTYACTRCGQTRTESGGAAVPHDYVVVVQAPTCTHAGLRMYTCSRCGDSHTAPGEAALGHHRIVAIQAPTCTRAGLRVYTCSRCEDRVTAPGAAALGHNFSRTAQEPTCTEPGIYTHTCARCAYTYTEPGPPSMGHTFGPWQEAGPDTEVRICQICGAEETRSASTADVELPPTPMPTHPQPPPVAGVPPAPAAPAVPAGGFVSQLLRNDPVGTIRILDLEIEFTTVDVAAGGFSVLLLVLAILFTISVILAVMRERRTYRAYIQRQQAAEAEDRKHDFR